MSDEWLVNIYPAQPYTTGSSEVQPRGSLLTTFAPINLNYTRRLNANGVGSIGFDIPFSDPNLTADIFAPWRCDWTLTRNSIKVTQGVVGPPTLSPHEQKVAFVGAEYEQYLQQCFWPFDYTTAVGTDETDPNALVAYWLNSNLIDDALAAWVAAMNQRTDTLWLNLNTYGADDNPGSHLSTDPANSFPDLFMIQRSDFTTMYDNLNNIAAVCGNFGFDWFITDDLPVSEGGQGTEWLRLMVFYPFYQTASLYSPLVGPDTIVSFDWTNIGPLSTRHYASTDGGLYSTDEYTPSSDVFRLLESQDDYSDQIYTQALLDVAAGAVGFVERNPQKSVPIKLIADNIDSNFYLARAGSVIDIDYPVPPYHTINASFRATELAFHVGTDTGGILMCDAQLEQIYDGEVVSGN